MRIIFVGIHNKPGMQPLDSKTKSGKIIDEIIKLLHNIDIECIKINLYDCDYHPTNYIVQLNYQIDWLRKLKPQKYDLVVLLGKLVKNEIDYDFVKIIYLYVIRQVYLARHKQNILLKIQQTL